jgi:hypothetical protein
MVDSEVVFELDAEEDEADEDVEVTGSSGERDVLYENVIAWEVAQ